MKDNPAVNFKTFTNNLKEKKITKDQDAQFMRKGKSGSWKEYINEDMAHEIDRWTQNEIAGSDYDLNTLLVTK